ncbi:hypothetical protein [Leisingera sp.]|uniref:hypothetical protein n=1 Tax=Leisingera sp. TaxID=1879318 RepID=UPI002B268E74|nr:hypothetical protein [Leisingera sp.]
MRLLARAIENQERAQKFIFFRFKASRPVDQDSDARIVAGKVECTQATIQFKPDGTILTANGNFLAVLGYRLEEITGRLHSKLVASDLAAGAEYRAFWKDLAGGRVSKFSSAADPAPAADVVAFQRPAAPAPAA